MKTFFLTLVLIQAIFLGVAQSGNETVTIKFDGLIRQYKVHIPKHYDDKHNYPLIFILHGGGGTANGMVRFTKRRFNYLAERDSFIAVYPGGYEKGWNDGERDTLAVARQLSIDDVGFFDFMINDISQKLSVDRERIFACGISNGGFMVQRLAIERSDIFKAIAVVAANISEDQQLKFVQQPVPVMFICGTADPLVPYYGGPVVVLNQKRGEVLSMDESINYWRKQNGCTSFDGKYSFPDLNKADGCKAYKSVWHNPDNPKIKVVQIKIENGGHTWPKAKQYLPRKLVGNTNRDFNGCDEIWSFFKSTQDEMAQKEN